MACVTNGRALGWCKYIDILKQPLCPSLPFTYQYPSDNDALYALILSTDEPLTRVYIFLQVAGCVRKYFRQYRGEGKGEKIKHTHGGTAHLDPDFAFIFRLII